MNADTPFFGLLRCALWGGEAPAADETVFELFKRQTLIALPAPVLSRVPMPEALRGGWEKAVYAQVSRNVYYSRAEAALPVTVPYAVLKGSSAAKYYRFPEYRAVGDIDIMPRQDDFEAACEALLAAGYTENTVHFPNEPLRHRRFLRHRVEVEVHARFAQLKDEQKSRQLDRLIIDSAGPNHSLPDPVNGLVLLEHIRQHLQEGVGLRQIIDWMMFAHRCLDDPQWPAFRPNAETFGLVRLAQVCTQMCVLYLGLPARAWCAGVDASLCDRLMDDILTGGNFGHEYGRDSRVSQKVLAAAGSPRAVFHLLQSRGLDNWPASRTTPLLRPFAWLYQLGRYLKKGALRPAALRRLRNEAATVRRRGALLKALGADQ